MNQRVLTPLLLAGMFLLALLCVTDVGAQGQGKRVGVLMITGEKVGQEWMQPFYRRLGELGWVKGDNLTIEYRDVGGDPTRFAEPAAELVRRHVDVLFPVGPPAVRAAFAATREIPIVAHDFETDPVDAGYAQSYAKPGGNLTGLFLDTPDLAGKWIELLKTLMPRLSRAVVLFDATSGPVPLKAVREVAPSFGVKLQVLRIERPEDIDHAPTAFQARPQALIALPSPMMYIHSNRLAKLAKQQRLPAISMFIPFAEEGGLIAYGPEQVHAEERCAELVAKILNGARPGDLAIERPTKFEFVLNLKAARRLRLAVPDTVLLRADRVIQ